MRHAIGTVTAAIILSFLPGAGGAPGLHAQTVQQLRPGDRIDVTAVAASGLYVYRGIDETYLIGTSLASGDDVRILVDGITEVKRSRGHDPRRRGALRGGGIGLAFGAVLALAMIRDGEECFGDGPCVSFWEVAGGGAVAGGVLGALYRPERWESLEWPGQTSFSIGPTFRGTGVQLSLRRAR